MQYTGNIIRPPSEADSIILQVTVGCSHNKCSFCGAYKEKRFTCKPWESIEADISFAARHCTRLSKLFLADGDALILPQQKLAQILQAISRELPWVNKISSYASARSIRSKSSEELLELKGLGLKRLYLGLESGLDELLAEIQKGESSESMVAVAERIHQAGLFLSVTVLLGLAGEHRSQQHAAATAKVLNRMRPQQVAALMYMPLANTELGQKVASGEYPLPAAPGLLQELKTLIAGLTLDRSQFHANHASNYLPLAGRLKRDKQVFLDLIDQALKGDAGLVPEWRRAL